MQLFLDCDGVLADFVGGATKVLGMHPNEFEKKYGEAKMWNIIEDHHDSYELFDAVKHLAPIILTGRPRGEWAVEQKLLFRDKYYPGTPMIVCRSQDKIKYAEPGDVIVDDWHKYKHLWVNGGGIWVMHTSAKDSIRQLKELGVI
jgi:hypothetical protein